jgi:hypothetical protein
MLDAQTSAHSWRSAGFQTCCVADFLVGRPSNRAGVPQVWKPATQKVWKPALRPVMQKHLGNTPVSAATTAGIASSVQVFGTFWLAFAR